MAAYLRKIGKVSEIQLKKEQNHRMKILWKRIESREYNFL